LTLTESTLQFCCAIWHDGIFDLPTSLLEADTLDWDASFGGPAFPWANFENIQRFNPATPERLKNWKNAPPTIVIHSEKDYRCPITEGLSVFRTLQVQGVPSRFVTFEDEGHWVLKPENSKFWYAAVWDWMDRCVKGELVRGDKEW
jgi:dipeptidyl aminopeptidase/acylaminoacyl peptidase